MHYINTDAIRDATAFGEDYLVAPVRAMQSMDLDGGYVPRAEIERSVPAWNGRPVTLNHPQTPDGDLVSAANSPDVAEKTWLGYYFNAETAETDDGRLALDGEIWLNRGHADDLGGQAADVVAAIEAGDDVAVSTAYFGDPLDPGDYDGEHRDAVVGNLRPDHLAVLPNADGKCSVADGCLAGERAPAANDDPAADRTLRLTAPDPAKPTMPDDDTTTPPATTPDPEEFGAQAGESFSNKVRAMLGLHTTPMERDDYIEDLVANHDFTRDSLESMGDECLERTFRAFNDDEQPDGDEAADAAADADDDTETADTPDGDEAGEDGEDADVVTLTEDDLDARIAAKADELVDQKVEAALAANEEASRRADLIATIVANDVDDQYDRDELTDTPPAVLETIAADLEANAAPAANFAAQRGARADSAGPDPAEDFPALSVNEYDADAGGDD